MNEENIKDPNQLDLFVGILLTPEQEDMINRFIAGQENASLFAERSNQQFEKLLVDNGFIFGIDFVNTFKIETVTKTRTFGSQYYKNEFEAEVTYPNISGTISLKVKRFDTNEGELKDYTVYIDFHKGKVKSHYV